MIGLRLRLSVRSRLQPRTARDDKPPSLQLDHAQQLSERTRQARPAAAACYTLIVCIWSGHLHSYGQVHGSWSTVAWHPPPSRNHHHRLPLRSCTLPRSCLHLRSRLSPTRKYPRAITQTSPPRRLFLWTPAATLARRHGILCPSTPPRPSRTRTLLSITPTASLTCPNQCLNLCLTHILITILNLPLNTPSP